MTLPNESRNSKLLERMAPISVRTDSSWSACEGIAEDVGAELAAMPEMYARGGVLANRFARRFGVIGRLEVCGGDARYKR
jgi:hypothetical protein